MFIELFSSIEQGEPRIRQQLCMSTDTPKKFRLQKERHVVVRNSHLGDAVESGTELGRQVLSVLRSWLGNMAYVSW